MTGALAATEAWWEPGTRHAYHTNTYGHLVGEIVRRCTGEMPGDRLRAFAASLDADVWCGVPASEQHRCADVHLGSGDTRSAPCDFARLSGDPLMVALGYFNPPGYSSSGCRQHARMARRAGAVDERARLGQRCCPDLRGVARPGRLLSPELLAEATARAVRRLLPGARRGRRRSASASSRRCRIARSARTREASVTSAPAAPSASPIPTRGVAFGYVMNHVIPRWQSTRNRALIDSRLRVALTPQVESSASRTQVRPFNTPLRGSTRSSSHGVECCARRRTSLPWPRVASTCSTAIATATGPPSSDGETFGADLDRLVGRSIRPPRISLNSSIRPDRRTA